MDFALALHWVEEDLSPGFRTQGIGTLVCLFGYRIGWTISPAQYVCERERERERERARERDVAQSLVVLPAAALTLKLYTLIRPVIPGMLRACLPARHMVLSLH